MSIAFASIQSLEIAAWPDLDHAVLGDWRLRYARGFSGRGNSATALRDGATLSDADIDAVEDFYRAHNLPALIRLTPFVDSGLDRRLADRGYATKSASEYRVVSLKGPRAFEPGLIHADTPTSAWIADFGRLNGRVDFNPETMAAMLERVEARATFGSIVEDGRRVAIGMGVLNDGLMEVQSIAVDATMRQRGLGRRLVGGLLAWGCSNGADAAILSVEATNDPAIRLYTSLGFEKTAGYHYRIKALA